MNHPSLHSGIARCLQGIACLIATCFGVAAQAQTIDDLLEHCPTAAEISAIDARLRINFNVDLTAPTLVCPAQGTTPGLTKLKRNIYNILVASQRITFTRGLPWAPSRTNLWDWFVLDSGLKGINIHNNGGSFCCDGDGVISIHSGTNSYSTFSNTWMDDNGAGGGLNSALGLFVHEARHIRFGGHTCGTSDQSLSEMGGYGVTYFMHVWMSRYSDPNFLRPRSGPASGYRDRHGYSAAELETSQAICQKPVYTTKKVTEFYNSVLRHYFVTISDAEANAIDSGSAGPGWSRTGVSFDAYTSEATAPPNTRPVCRFYGSVSPGPNSHFYTASEDECAGLKHLQSITPANVPRWNYENLAFYLPVPIAASPRLANTLYFCSAPPGRTQTPIYRFYNNRAAQNDSNHRYVTDGGVRQQMSAAGWRDEGITLCSER